MNPDFDPYLSALVAIFEFMNLSFKIHVNFDLCCCKLEHIYPFMIVWIYAFSQILNAQFHACRVHLKHSLLKQDFTKFNLVWVLYFYSIGHLYLIFLEFRWFICTIFVSQSMSWRGIILLFFPNWKYILKVLNFMNIWS